MAVDILKVVTSKRAALLQKLHKKLKRRFAPLGLNLTLRDEAGWKTADFEPCCEFCNQMMVSGKVCQSAVRSLGGQVLAEDKSLSTTSPAGCSLVGVPLRHRRRTIGSAVACYPTREMLEEEHLARLCDAMELDRKMMTRLGLEACQRLQSDVQEILLVTEQLLESEQGHLVSQEEIANLSINLATTYEELSLVYRASGSMKVGRNPRDYLQNICDELCEVTNVESVAAIVYPHNTTQEEDTVITSGQCKLDEDQLKLLASVHLAPRFTQDNRGIVENDFDSGDSTLLDGAVQSVVAVPIVTDGPPAGILLAINRFNGDFDSVDLKLLSSIGNQSAVFLANNRLYGDLQDLLMGVLHALTATIDAKDPYTCGHSNRVAMISRRLAEACGFDAKRVHRIYLSGLLHDIGKIGVPEQTLRKEGRLTDEEYDQLKSHPALGAKILGGIRQLDDVILGIMLHHERLDGKGYPHGVQGEQFPIDARIVGLADSFDAMTSDRTYRKALPLEVVCDEIRRHSGTQFDPMLVEKMLSWDLEALLKELHQPAEVVLPVDGEKEQG